MTDPAAPLEVVEVRTDPAAAFDVVDDALPLPGLVDDARPGASPLELAARRTLRALAAEGRLTDANAVQCQLLLDLCAGYSASVRHAGGKVTVAASAVVAQIQNLLTALGTDTDRGGDDDDDAWRELVGDLRAASRLAATGGGAASGDST